MCRLLAIFIVALVALAEPAWAATYYVDKLGSNSNSCATASTASSDRTKAKLTFGNSNGSGGIACLSAGDTLIVGNGTYVEAEIYITVSGTSTSRITVQAENKWGAVVSSISSCNPNISLYGSYITIDGLDLVINSSNVYCTPNSAAGTGVRMWNPYTNGIVRNIRTDNPYGINTSASNAIRSHGIKSNQANSLLEYNELAAGLEVLCEACIVRYNRITGGGQWREGIVAKAGFSNVQIYGNEIDDANAGGFYLYGGIKIGGSTNNNPPWECINCVAHHNIVKRYSGATCCYSLGFQSAKDSQFYNNTVIAGPKGIAAEMSCCALNNNSNVSWKNNIFQCSNGAAQGTMGGSYTIDYNDFYECTSAPSQTHAFSADPLFVNAAGGVYGLTASSTMINAGTNVGLPYNGTAPDLGAHETIDFAFCAVEAATPTVMNITFTNNVQPPLRPSSSITGFSARENSSGKTVNSQTRVGDNQIDVTVSVAFSAGTTIDFSYDTGTGNVTDSPCLTDPTCALGNQRLNAITNQSCTNNVGAAASHVFTQAAFEFHDLRGTEAAPVIKPYASAPENTSIKVVPGGMVRIRLSVTCTTADCPPAGLIPRYSRNSGAYTVIPDTYGADNIAFVGTGPDPDIPNSGTATTDQLSTSGTFAACAIVRTSNAIPTVDIALNGKTECEYTLAFDTDAVAGDTYDIRLYDQGGSALNTYTVTPRITIEPMSGGVADNWIDWMTLTLLPILGRIESQTAKAASNFVVGYPNIDQVTVEGLSCTGLKTSGTGLKRTVTCLH